MKGQPIPEQAPAGFVDQLLARCLQQAAPRLLPATTIRVPRLAPALAFYRDILGFAVTSHVPHVLAVLELAEGSLMLWQQDARAGRGERAQRATDLQPFRPSHFRIEVPRLHALHQQLRAGLVRSGQAGALPQWQPWQAWELCCRDAVGNTLVFTQPAREGGATGAA